MTVLLLHGLGGDRAQALDLLAPVLPPEVVAPDIRAHGDSPLLGDAPDFALDALAAELDVPPGPLTIVGISMGAAIGLRLALRRAVDVERFVAVRPAFTDRPLPPNLAPFPVIGELLATYGAADGEHRFRSSAMYQRATLESRLGARGLIAQFRAPRAAKRAVRLVEIPRNRAFAPDDDLDRLAGARISVIGAVRDPVHPSAVAELWAERLPGASLEHAPARDEDLARYVEGIRRGVSRALT